MNKQLIQTVNLVLTFLTCIIIIFAGTSCTPEQVQSSQPIIDTIHTGIDSVPDSVKTQPWYIIAMLIADIATSCLATYATYKKR